MSDTWDAEDRAIARSLDAAPAAQTAGADDHLVDDYREVLAHMPLPEVTPPAGLEDRILSAALRRRPATVPALDPARSRARRRHRLQLAALAATAVAAAIVVGLIVTGGDSAPARPGGRITLATEHAPDLAALVRMTGTRSGTFTPTGGRVAVARNGAGAVAGLSEPGPVSIGLVSSEGTTVVGPARPVDGAIEFVVTHSERVTAVALLRNGAEIARAQLSSN